MRVGFKGFKEQVLTFLAAEPVTAGCPVTVADSGLISNSKADEEFAGIATQGGDKFAPVMISGYTKLSYTAGTPKCGWQYLTADGSGGVKIAASGKQARLVVEIDTDQKTIGVIL